MSSNQQAELTIRQAADKLGISENAIRQRIKRGTLSAEKIDGVWRVPFIDQSPTSRSTTAANGLDYESDQQGDQPAIDAQYRVTPAEIELAIERTGAKYSADVSGMFDRLDSLYRERLQEKDQLIEELRRRAEVAEAERDGLREATQAPEQGDNVSTDQGPHTGSQRPWWRFWRS